MYNTDRRNKTTQKRRNHICEQAVHLWQTSKRVAQIVYELAMGGLSVPLKVQAGSGAEGLLDLFNE